MVSGMRRMSSAADEHSESSTELIARISAEHDSPFEDGRRHRRAAVVVTPRPPASRTMSRRLAPLAVGAAVALVAATVIAVVRPADSTAVAAPDLNSAFLQRSTTTNPAPAQPPAAGPPRPPPAPPPRGPAAARAPPTGTSPARTSSPSTSKKVTQPAPVAAPPAAPAPSGGGTTAAGAHGWTLVGGDEFNGGLSSNWGVYQGPGNGGQGRRVASAITVQNGLLVIRGDSNGNTGGMAWHQNQRFGKWEIRARFPKGDSQYHPVLILWPNGSWPAGGEVDFAETNSAAPDVSFFLHYSSSNRQKYAKKTLDLTQWHNYAVEWVDGRITGYIDGQQWFQSTDPSTMPPDQMHATIQLDYFPHGGSPAPSEMDVDYMRIYK